MSDKTWSGLRFPLVFEKCPYCGSSEKVIGSVIGELIANGRAGEDTVSGVALQLVIADPRRAMLATPVMTVMEDICAKCGARYTVRIDVQERPITAQMKGGPKGGLPGMPPFMKG